MERFNRGALKPQNNGQWERGGAERMRNPAEESAEKWKRAIHVEVGHQEVWQGQLIQNQGRLSGGTSQLQLAYSLCLAPAFTVCTQNVANVGVLQCLELAVAVSGSWGGSDPLYPPVQPVSLGPHSVRWQLPQWQVKNFGCWPGQYVTLDVGGASVKFWRLVTVKSLKF